MPCDCSSIRACSSLKRITLPACPWMRGLHVRMEAVERHGDDVVRKPLRGEGAARFVPLHDRVDHAEQETGDGAGIDVLAERALIARGGNQYGHFVVEGPAAFQGVPFNFR